MHLSKKMLLTFWAIVFPFASIMECACATASAAGWPKPSNLPGVTELNIAWAISPPADYLQKICDRYENETGIKVNVIQESWSTFPNHFFAEMEARSASWDMVVGDSQWLGQSATQGYYVDITDLLVNEGIKETVTAASLSYYGEYPAGSGKYWAYPTEGDAIGWAFRKDLFGNENEKAAFEAKYGYALNVPATFQQLKDIATFFTRPENNLYGVALYTRKDYDEITMGFESLLFSWGNRWQDPQTNEVLEIINSPKAIEACGFYKDLYDNCQVPGLTNASFGETNEALISGKAAMIMNYLSFAGDLVNPLTNPHAQNTGFFANPAGPDGDQHTALGGQGISIVSFISPERQQAARDFIKWFAREDIQTAWAESGGFTCNKNVLKSETFLSATPYNPAFATSMESVMDFWNIPQYRLLLDVTQNELYKFIVEGQGTAQSTMDSIAGEHHRILKEFGYLTGIDGNFPDQESKVFPLIRYYPNPFNSFTTIDYQLREAAPLLINIYDGNGRYVKELFNKQLTPGKYSIVWDGTDGLGHSVESGSYFFQIISGKLTQTKKIVLIKNKS